MKTVKRIILAAAVAGLTLSAGALAQSAGEPGPNPGKHMGGHHKGMWGGKGDGGQWMERMAEELALSEEQRAQIRDIHQGARQAARDLHRQMKADRQAERQALQAGADKDELLELARKSAESRVAMMLQQRETRDRVQAVLTAEQRQELEQLKTEHRAQREERREKWQQKRSGAEQE